ncbi:right-handed parallel beta-helix repeat-containing protein [bacterium]|nr:right-handed parallel beta-helix repeat-containing protein [bacterium]
MLKIVFLVILFSLLSCSKTSQSDYLLPEECGGRCETATDTDSFQDALVNSSAAFSNCICLGEGVFEGEIRIGKPLRVIGRKDGRTYLKRLVVSNTYDVLLKDFSFRDLHSGSSALYVDESSVTMENISFFNVAAASLSGGRAIVVSGNESKIRIKDSRIEKTDGTCILIDGSHDVSLENVSLSKCGFAGVWVQNQSETAGNLSVKNSNFSEISAAAVEILGNTTLAVSESTVENVKKRDIMLESVGDGIVVKNFNVSKSGSIVIENSVIDGFARAGIIIDGGGDGQSVGAVFKNLSISSKEGSLGLVVQNAVEPDALRAGILRNDFDSADRERTEELFIIDSFFELQ